MNTKPSTPPPRGIDNWAGMAAVITGAASGFGRALALRCAREGIHCALADVDERGLQETLSAMGDRAGRSFTQRCDVADAAQVDDLAAKVRQQLGGVGLLFNNAGVFTGGPVWAATPQDWQWVLGVNVLGVANGIRSFVPAMMETGKSAWVVNTASIAGLLSPSDLAVYTASKHAVVGLSECLAADLARVGSPVGVSVLCPAYVDTDIAHAERHRPDHLSHGNPGHSRAMARARKAMEGGELSADDIADRTFAAVRMGDFYILPHRSTGAAVARRFAAIQQAF